MITHIKKGVTAILFLLLMDFSNAQVVARHGMTPAQYQTEFNDWSGKGYRVTSLCGYTRNGQELYAAIWNKISGPAWTARHGLSAAAYQDAFTDMSNQGYRLQSVSGYGVGGQAKFAAVWDKSGGGAWTAKHNMTAAQYQQAFDDYGKQGYRIQYLSGYVVNGIEYFAAIWEKTTGGAMVVRHNMTAAQYQQAFNDNAGQGYTLKLVSGYEKGGTDLFAAIWEKTTASFWVSRHGIPRMNYQHVFDNMYYQGFVPLYLNAYAADGGDKYNVIWKNTNISASDMKIMDDAAKHYMSTQGVSGLSFAVTKNGALVFAKAYGYANPATNEELSPNHSMRIMSISKSITAAGIMKLMEQNKITMNQHVFGPNSILGSKYATPADKPKLNQITVWQLLHHNSGLRTCNGESEFRDQTKSKDDVMKMLLADPNLLKYDPNTKNEYSNTGYFILSCIIEKISGQPYETFIRNNVLNPGGVGSGMYVGLASGGIKSSEANYTPDSKPNMQLWAGFGGWVARPIDLLKYLGSCDGAGTPPDIINASTHDTLTKDTPLSPGYGCGWIVSGNKQSHNGANGASRSWLAEIGGGLSIAVILNNPPSNDPDGHGKLLNEISTAVKNVSAFPSYNLY
ncbi:MAG: serine hydrolase [Chitinophagaceae bacterium]|nr:serine hydrolase [Chitinophagaceae bacterium]